jgi:hypothetical protein
LLLLEELTTVRIDDEEPLVLVRTPSARCFTAVPAVDGHSCRKFRVAGGLSVSTADSAEGRSSERHPNQVELAEPLRCLPQASPLSDRSGRRFKITRRTGVDRPGVDGPMPGP